MVTPALTNGDAEISGIHFNQDLKNIPILFSPTEPIMRVRTVPRLPVQPQTAWQALD